MHTFTATMHDVFHSYAMHFKGDLGVILACGLPLFFYDGQLQRYQMPGPCPGLRQIMHMHMLPPLIYSHTLVFSANLPCHASHMQPTARLEISDGDSIKDIRASLGVNQLAAVVKMYKTDKVKPSRLTKKVNSLVSHVFEEDDSAKSKSTAVVAAGAEPDVFDLLAAKGRSWAQHVAVSSCQATQVLQDKWAEIMQQKPAPPPEAKKAASKAK